MPWNVMLYAYYRTNIDTAVMPIEPTQSTVWSDDWKLNEEIIKKIKNQLYVCTNVLVYILYIRMHIKMISGLCCNT